MEVLRIRGGGRETALVTTRSRSRRKRKGKRRRRMNKREGQRQEAKGDTPFCYQRSRSYHDDVVDDDESLQQRR